MVYVLIVMAVVLPATVGYGQLLRHLLTIGNPSTFLRAVAIDGLLGLLVLGTLANFLNFFIGISSAVAAIVMVLGWVALAWRIRALGVRPTRGEIILFAVLFVFFVVESIRPMNYYDTALYHMQCVLWARAQAVPLGLGNLHQRLAMTTMWFPLAALLWLPGMKIAATLTISTLVTFLFSCLIADCGRWVILSPTGYRSLSDWFGVICVYGIAHAAFTMNELMSLSNDLPPVVATLAAFILLLPRDEDQPLADRLLLATLIATLAFTAKLSSAPLLAAIGLVLLWRWWREGFPRAMGRTIFASGVMVAVWIARSVWTSGAPLFPSRFLQLSSARWTVRNPYVMNWIMSWARLPGGKPDEVLASWDWLQPWSRQMLALELPWVLALILGVVLILSPFFVRRVPKVAAALWLLAIAGTAFWFLAAPDPRFGLGMIFSVVALPAAVVVSQIGWLRYRSVTVTLLAALCVAPLIRQQLVPTTAAGAMYRTQWDRVTWTTRKTEEGERIHIPGDGKTAWDTPLPGTPYFSPQLRVVQGPSGKIKEFYFPSPLWGGMNVAPMKRPVQ